ISTSFHNTSLESLEIGAAPVVRRFLDRLQLEPLLRRHLPPGRGRPEAMPTSLVLCTLVTNLLLARRPLYALPEWLARRVPEHLGLQPPQVALLPDDRLGRALHPLYRANPPSLLPPLVL